MAKRITTSALLMLMASAVFAQQPGAIGNLPPNARHMSDEQKDLYLRALQEHSLEMHDLSNRILAEQDPVKRQDLKDRQFQLMKDYRVRMMGLLQELKERKERRAPIR